MTGLPDFCLPDFFIPDFFILYFRTSELPDFLHYTGMSLLTFFERKAA